MALKKTRALHAGANARLQLLLENFKLKKGHNYVKKKNPEDLVLLKGRSGSNLKAPNKKIAADNTLFFYFYLRNKA